ncbi:MAG TPA: hypothetical protein VIG08_00130 [Gemmatimonadales bacterium]|jgi:hypothetical protein
MQVTAEVTRADAAWNGLTAAQRLAHEFATTTVAEGTEGISLGLARVRLEMADTPSAGAARVSSSGGDGPPVAVVVQYLRN